MNVLFHSDIVLLPLEIKIITRTIKNIICTCIALHVLRVKQNLGFIITSKLKKHRFCFI